MSGYSASDYSISGHDPELGAPAESPRRPTPARDALAEALSARGRDGRDLSGEVRVLRSYGYTVHEPGESCPQLLRDRMPHAARIGDPMTSHAAAPPLPSQRAAAFAVLEILDRDAAELDRGGVVNDGSTADELEFRLGRPVWRRVSDLETLGLIEPVTVERREGDVTLHEPLTRPGRSGREQIAHRITLKGRTYVQEIRDRT